MARKKENPILTDKLPVHVAFIMDGNGRWAKKRGMPRSFGHREGAKNFKKIVRYCKDIGIKYISFYAFSTENWKRAEDEVNAIMELFREYIVDVRDHIGEEVKVIFLGDKSAFDDDLREKMLTLEEDSKDFDKMTLLLAINYGGRAELTHAMYEIAKEIEAKKIGSSQVNDKLIEDHLYTKGIPDVDLLIRPSGELRLSNFLLWQSAYSEFYFTDVLWPDFSPKELNKAIEDYSKRVRRFGGV